MSEMIEMAQRLDALVRKVKQLEASIERAAPISAMYVSNAAQSIPNNTDKIVNFEDQLWDTHNAVTTGVDVWKFTAPRAAKYVVLSNLLYTTTTAWALGEVASLRLMINDASYLEIDRQDALNSSGTASYRPTHGFGAANLAVGQYINIHVLQQSGGPLALHNVDDNIYIIIFAIS